MDHIVLGCIVIVAGCLMILKRRQFNKDALAFQHKAFGFNFSKKTADLNARLVIPFGLLFIVLGTLMILGISDDLLP